MRNSFHFTVSDTFLIEGRGLILSPFFPLDQYRFDGNEHVSIETPDGRLFQVDANVEIPYLSPNPKVPQAMFLIRDAKKSDVPIGSILWVLNKTPEQVTVMIGGSGETFRWDHCVKGGIIDPTKQDASDQASSQSQHNRK